jgi:hypothetical protein
MYFFDVVNLRAMCRNSAFGKIMKTTTILIVTACFCFTAMVHAEVYKCKNADGKISYSDQECPGSTAVQTPPKSAPGPAATQPAKQEERFTNVIKKEEPNQPRVYSRYSPEPDPPMSQQEKDKWRALAKEMGQKFDAAMADLRRQCKGGDAKACKEIACYSLDARSGPAEDFLYCAKARGLMHGPYWVITSGSPDPDPQNDKHLLEAALTPRLPAGRHVSSASRMQLMCFRKNGSRTDPLADQYNVEQILYVSKGANGPVLTHAFAQWGYGTYGTKAMPEYKTLDELVDKTCER